MPKYFSFCRLGKKPDKFYLLCIYLLYKVMKLLKNDSTRIKDYFKILLPQPRLIILIETLSSICSMGFGLLKAPAPSPTPYSISLALIGALRTPLGLSNGVGR
jgi:hypothetical protein